MSSPEPILSREELEAILGEPDLASSPFRADAPRPRPRPFARALKNYGVDQGRLSSTTHQRPIDFELLQVTSIPVAEFAASLADEDRAFVLRFADGTGAGTIAIGRSLLFGWLSMAFGAPESLDVPVPGRSYSRIEARFLRRLAEEFVPNLVQSLGDLAPGHCRLAEMVEPEFLPEVTSPRLLAGAFEVTGLGEPGRLRIGFPDDWIDTAERGSKSAVERAQIEPGHLMEMPVLVQAEVGSAQLSLGTIASLQPGAVIPIDGHGEGSILVRIEGAPKFRAARGSAGLQAAVKVVSRW